MLVLVAAYAREALWAQNLKGGPSLSRLSRCGSLWSASGVLHSVTAWVQKLGIAQACLIRRYQRSKQEGVQRWGTGHPIFGEVAKVVCVRGNGYLSLEAMGEGHPSQRNMKITSRQCDRYKPPKETQVLNGPKKPGQDTTRMQTR